MQITQILERRTTKAPLGVLIHARKLLKAMQTLDAQPGIRIEAWGAWRASNGELIFADGHAVSEIKQRWVVAYVNGKHIRMRPSESVHELQRAYLLLKGRFGPCVHET